MGIVMFLIGGIVFGLCILIPGRPLFDKLENVTQPFPVYEGALFVSESGGAKENTGVRPYRNYLGRQCYSISWWKTIQLDISDIPNVDSRLLCEYYMDHISSCGFSDFRFFSIDAKRVPFLVSDGDIVLARDGGSRHEIAEARGSQGSVRMECRIFDIFDGGIHQVDSMRHTSLGDEKKAMKGKRVARIDIFLFDSGYTESAGLW